MTQAEVRYKAARTALQLKREATAAARALLKSQVDKHWAELDVEEAREKAEDEALASTQREWKVCCRPLHLHRDIVD